MGAKISTYSWMERRPSGIRSGLTAAPLAIAAVLLAHGAHAQSWPSWETVVNNGTLAPTSTPQTSTPYYFSYNQPSINDSGSRGVPRPFEAAAAEAAAGVAAAAA